MLRPITRSFLVVASILLAACHDDSTAPVNPGTMTLVQVNGRTLPVPIRYGPDSGFIASGTITLGVDGTYHSLITHSMSQPVGGFGYITTGDEGTWTSRKDSVFLASRNPPDLGYGPLRGTLATGSLVLVRHDTTFRFESR